LAWLDRNQLAEKEEFEAKQKELEEVANPIMMKVYRDAAGGVPPAAGGFGAGGGSGPRVEEVD